jgi:hypothetical protein
VAEIDIKKNKAHAAADSWGADLANVQDETIACGDRTTSSRRRMPRCALGHLCPVLRRAFEHSSGRFVQAAQRIDAVEHERRELAKAVTIGTRVYPHSFTLGCNTAGLFVTGAAAKSDYASIIRVTAENGRQLSAEARISLSKPADLFGAPRRRGAGDDLVHPDRPPWRNHRLLPGGVRRRDDHEVAGKSGYGPRRDP